MGPEFQRFGPKYAASDVFDPITHRLKFMLQRHQTLLEYAHAVSRSEGIERLEV